MLTYFRHRGEASLQDTRVSELYLKPADVPFVSLGFRMILPDAAVQRHVDLQPGMLRTMLMCSRY